MTGKFRIVDEAFPSIIINRRAKTQKKLGKILYEMATDENFDKWIKEIVRETWAGVKTLSNRLWPLHKWNKNKKVYILEDWLKKDILDVMEVLKNTKSYRSWKWRDKQKLINVMFYVLYLHNN